MTFANIDVKTPLYKNLKIMKLNDVYQFE